MIVYNLLSEYGIFYEIDTLEDKKSDTEHFLLYKVLMECIAPNYVTLL